MTYPWRDPPQIPRPPTDPRRCPQCGETEECTGDQRWQHERDYRGSETTWWREAVSASVGPLVSVDDKGVVEVTR